MAGAAVCWCQGETVKGERNVNLYKASIEAEALDLNQLDRQAVTARHGRQVVGTLAASVALQGLTLISGALLARLLGVEGRGELAGVLLWPNLVAAIGSLGLQTAFAFWAASQPLTTPRLVRCLIWLSPVQGLLLAVILGFPLVVLGLHRTPWIVPAGMAYMVAYVPVSLGFLYVSGVNQGLSRFRAFNRNRLLVQACYVGGVLTLWLIQNRQLELVLAVVILSYFIGIVASVSQLRRTLPAGKGESRSLVAPMLRYGIKSHFGNLNPIETMQLDLAFVVLFIGPRWAGLYAVAVVAGAVIRSQGVAIGLVTFAHVASMHGVEDRRRATSQTFRLTLILGVATGLLLFLGAQTLVPFLYGKSFTGAIPLVRILLVGALLASLRQVLGDCLRAARKPLAATIAESVSWVVLVLSAALLLQRLGATGVALAVTLGYAVSLTITVFFVRTMRVLPSDLVPRPSDVAVLVRIARSTITADRKDKQRLVATG